MKKECAQGYDCDACKGIEGMTLRDWFAGMAMQGLCVDWESERKFKEISEHAYDHADAMLCARLAYTPKEFWVVVSAQGKPLSVHTTKPTDSEFHCIKVREVVE